MFDVLSELIVNVYAEFRQKIIDESIPKQDMMVKDRLLAIAFIELEVSLLELENATKSAYQTFRLYGEGKKTATKVIIKNRLKALDECFESFVKSFSRAEAKAYFGKEVYDAEFLFRYFVKMGNGGYPVFIGLIRNVCPVQLRNGDRITTQISYPTKEPSTELFTIPYYEYYDMSEFEARFSLGTFEKRGHWEEVLEEWLKVEAKGIRANIVMRRVDLNIPSECQEALKTADESIKAIEGVRRELAKFIQRNYPLEKILSLVK